MQCLDTMIFNVGLRVRWSNETHCCGSSGMPGWWDWGPIRHRTPRPACVKACLQNWSDEAETPEKTTPGKPPQVGERGARCECASGTLAERWPSWRTAPWPPCAEKHGWVQTDRPISTCSVFFTTNMKWTRLALWRRPQNQYRCHKWAGWTL